MCSRKCKIIHLIIRILHFYLQPLSKKQLKEVTSVLEGFAKKGQEVQITTEVKSR